MGKMVSKKALVAGQIFLYLFTLVIVVLVLIFGYRMVSNFQDRSEELTLLKFKKDLQATIEGVTFGTKKVRTFDVPPGYKDFWLIDPATMGKCPYADRVPPLIQDSINSGSPHNAFLLGPEKFEAWEMRRVYVDFGCVFAEISRNQLQLTLSKGAE
ncbi:hypothetical protein HYS48_05290 [Candidatus Woesearchaeota archaeon]|nr:hypothetical protein [Candidatus Woesearchaeota archaeon]